HREDRAKDFLLRDPMALADAGKEGRAEEVATRGELAVGLEDLGALLEAGVDQLLDLRELRRGVDRAHVGVLVERVTDSERGKACLQLVEQRLVDALLNEEPAAGAAHLTLVEVDAI